MNRAATAQRKRGQSSLLDFEESEVRLLVQSDEPRFHDALLAGGSYLVGISHGLGRESDMNALCSLDDMGVSHDVAVGIDDDSGADDMLAGDDGGLTATTLFESSVAGNENLNHRWRNSGGKLLDGEVELLHHERGFGRARAHGARPVGDIGFVLKGVFVGRVRVFGTGGGRGLRRGWLAKSGSGK